MCSSWAVDPLELPPRGAPPGSERAPPPSMLVVGAGATGVQVASIFNAFGSRVTFFETAPRILMSEDEDVAAAICAALPSWRPWPWLGI
jgi:pyruvate/2-oxoglutarate dehydrogenase complex dihydrolipoamide dehydrogenase (E3) component